MAKGFKHGAGGNSSLNFKVVGSTTEPVNPKENMIWVNTDQEITSWEFSFTQPAEPEEGMVWIGTSTTSPAKFNALKKNSIQVYPIDAKQYVSGAWVARTAKSYQGNAWVPWVTNLVLLDANGFHSTFSKKGTSNQYCSVTVGTNSITMVANNTEAETVYAWGAFNNKYDLTNYSTISFKVTNDDDGKGGGLGASNSTSYSGYVASKTFTSSGTYTVDISSLKGAYYIVAHARGDATKSTCKITYIELKT